MASSVDVIWLEVVTYCSQSGSCNIHCSQSGSGEFHCSQSV